MIEGGLGPILADDVKAAWLELDTVHLLPRQYGHTEGLVLKGQHGGSDEVQLQLAQVGPELVLVILSRPGPYDTWRQLLIPWRKVLAVTL